MWVMLTQRFQWSAHLDVVSFMILHMKVSTECGTHWVHGLRLYSMISNSYQKNRRFLWINCGNPFLGRSPHGVFSFDVMFFTMKCQLAMKTIKVKLSTGQREHMEGTNANISSDLVVSSVAALGSAYTGYMGYAGYVPYCSEAIKDM